MGRLTKSLIITADDFGLHPAVNGAVAIAYERGVLTAASLMIGAPASAEALALARRLPGLRVGLHLVIADGWSNLPHAEIPQLTDSHGWMDARVVARSFRILRPAVFRQLRRELQAQFAAYRKTGLPLDHINVHKHLHLHPLVLKLVMQEALANGAPPVRVPFEPSWAAVRRSSLSHFTTELTNVWATAARWRLRRAGLACNDRLFGLSDTGKLREESVLRFIARLPHGVSELYLHPAEKGLADSTLPDRAARGAELDVLLSPRVGAAVRSCGARLCGFRDAAGRMASVVPLND